ncbi:hypothetical protein FDH86_gp092 [Arthrobacter phage Tank]|uniref:Uncharacterized protein n=1 Tax=Arthrobacter phage Tank TaxID=1772319 RepID=A0A0U4KBF9_9CAUD|nr:hypothetical protein FDH86_gp092 [Arthrobacter phage Tank]ALY10627.1 hypothetical protein TANK_92 [Arthrobacter phage Tank]
MDFWQLFWMIYPGVAFTTAFFFARFHYFYLDKESPTLGFSACMGMFAGIGWPIGLPSLLLMYRIHHEVAKAKRIEDKGLELSEALRMMNRNPENFEAAAQDVLAKLRVRRDIERTKARKKQHANWDELFEKGSGNRPTY